MLFFFRGTKSYKEFYLKFGKLLSLLESGNLTRKIDFLKRRGRSIIIAEDSATSIIEMFDKIPRNIQTVLQEYKYVR